MVLPQKGHILRIFIGESDRHKGKPLYEWIVQKAREEGLAGATVIKGIEGFGASSRLHTSKLLRLSDDLPVVIELIDTLDKIDHFIPVIDDAVREGLAIIENADIRFYRSRNPSKEEKNESEKG